MIGPKPLEANVYARTWIESLVRSNDQALLTTAKATLNEQFYDYAVRDSYFPSQILVWQILDLANRYTDLTLEEVSLAVELSEVLIDTLIRKYLNVSSCCSWCCHDRIIQINGLLSTTSEMSYRPHYCAFCSQQILVSIFQSINLDLNCLLTEMIEILAIALLAIASKFTRNQSNYPFIKQQSSGRWFSKFYPQIEFQVLLELNWRVNLDTLSSYIGSIIEQLFQSNILDHLDIPVKRDSLLKLSEHLTLIFYGHRIEFIQELSLKFFAICGSFEMRKESERFRVNKLFVGASIVYSALSRLVPVKCLTYYNPLNKVLAWISELTQQKCCWILLSLANLLQHYYCRNCFNSAVLQPV